jgi:hypothetical protein
MSGPAHRDPRWRYFPIRETPTRSRKASPGYWEGAAADWEDLTGSVTCGYRIAILPERSGLAILDCDVRGVWELAGSSTAVLREHHGIDDLHEVAAGRGKEIPATYEVSTPSGGVHLYFAQNPHCRVTSRGHREGWLIDVKASPNTYAVAPPTADYEVVHDLPAAVLPYWLARHIRGLGLRMGGGHSAGRQVSGAEAPLTDPMREGILVFVAESNSQGGWNNCIYWAANRFFEAGELLEETLAVLLEAAAPWNETEQRRARATVESAWQRHEEES